MTYTNVGVALNIRDFVFQNGCSRWYCQNKTEKWEEENNEEWNSDGIQNEKPCKKIFDVQFTNDSVKLSFEKITWTWQRIGLVPKRCLVLSSIYYNFICHFHFTDLNNHPLCWNRSLTACSWSSFNTRCYQTLGCCIPTIDAPISWKHINVQYISQHACIHHFSLNPINLYN